MDVEVRCEVAGTVTRVAVPPGGDVTLGGAVVFVEAMKMDIPVVAPVAGTITAVHVSEGDAVAEKQVVATVTPAAPGA